MTLRTASYSAPIGPLTLVAQEDRLHAILWPHEALPANVSPGSCPILDKTAVQLDDYFARRLTAFCLPRADRGTPFQQQVWAALDRIPFGRTTTYAAIARAIGRPSAARAVGAAIGKNPWPILIPCHRVVGSSGSLTGFAGGLVAKSQLLQHESPLIQISSIA